MGRLPRDAGEKKRKGGRKKGEGGGGWSGGEEARVKSETGLVPAFHSHWPRRSLYRWSPSSFSSAAPAPSAAPFPGESSPVVPSSSSSSSSSSFDRLSAVSGPGYAMKTSLREFRETLPNLPRNRSSPPRSLSILPLLVLQSPLGFSLRAISYRRGFSAVYLYFIWRRSSLSPPRPSTSIPRPSIVDRQWIELPFLLYSKKLQRAAFLRPEEPGLIDGPTFS